jgi:hypothetical protein
MITNLSPFTKNNQVRRKIRFTKQGLAFIIFISATFVFACLALELFEILLGDLL